MTNDFKMIVFKQLTISIKTQHDNKINVSCSANQQNVTLLNMTINTVETLNLSTLFGALFVFSAFIETLDFFFSQEIRPPFSIPFSVIYPVITQYVMDILCSYNYIPGNNPVCYGYIYIIVRFY